MSVAFNVAFNVSFKVTFCGGGSDGAGAMVHKINRVFGSRPKLGERGTGTERTLRWELAWEQEREPGPADRSTGPVLESDEFDERNWQARRM